MQLTEWSSWDLQISETSINKCWHLIIYLIVMLQTFGKISTIRRTEVLPFEHKIPLKPSSKLGGSSDVSEVIHVYYINYGANHMGAILLRVI